jgi:outer membrane murein-binding lipoprotein Lpp
MLAAALVVGAVVQFWLPASTRSHHQPDQMAEAVARLSAEVSRLSQEQAMPSVVLARHRSSICFIYALYSLNPLGGGRRLRAIRTRVSGTGFVVAPGVVATNRHVAQPWFDDDQDGIFIRRGAVPRLERLVAFFPDLPAPIELTDVQVSAAQDLAIAHFAATTETASLQPLPLAEASAVAGEPVIVVAIPWALR